MEYSQKDKDRFWGKVAFSQAGCWEWKAYIDRKGYGHFRLAGKVFRAHRVAYLLANDGIPQELSIDHLCRNRKCVNPSHLEPVTIKENVMRGFGFCAINARKKYCSNGHQLIEGNIYTNNPVTRMCIACARVKSLEQRMNKPEYVKEYRKTYYQHHRDEIIARAKDWVGENKEHVRTMKSNWYQKNRTKILAKLRGKRATEN